MISINVLLVVSLCAVHTVMSFVTPSIKHSILSQAQARISPSLAQSRARLQPMQMNFFGDAIRFFTNMNKEASAKHILIKGDGGREKLLAVKNELQNAEDLNTAFSEMASKISECPSASRGGNLGTFKPGMMVKEFDEVVFGEAVGQVHGPVQTQFGNHLILITRRYEGDEAKK